MDERKEFYWWQPVMRTNHLSMQEMLEVANTMNRNVFSSYVRWDTGALVVLEFLAPDTATSSWWSARRPWCSAPTMPRAARSSPPQCDQGHGEALLVRPLIDSCTGHHIHVLRGLTTDRRDADGVGERVAT